MLGKGVVLDGLAVLWIHGRERHQLTAFLIGDLACGGGLETTLRRGRAGMSCFLVTTPKLCRVTRKPHRL